MLKLICIEGNNQGQEKKIRNHEIVIGRGNEADWILHDSKVSRRHARIYEENEIYYIEDLGSRNGVLLNNKEIKSRVQLQFDQEITIGRSIIIFTEKTLDLKKKMNMSSNYMLLTEQLDREHRTQTLQIDVPKNKKSFLDYFRKSKNK